MLFEKVLDFLYPIPQNFKKFESTPQAFTSGEGCCSSLFLTAPSTYNFFSIRNIDVKDARVLKNDCPVFRIRNKVLFALTGLFVPVLTQRDTNRKACDAFGRLRDAAGFQAVALKSLAVTTHQIAALLNYSWTVLTFAFAAPVYVITAIALLALSVPFDCCGKEGISDGIAIASYSALCAAGSLMHGVPRAVIGIFQKALTLCFIPAYLSGRAISSCLSKKEDNSNKSSSLPN